MRVKYQQLIKDNNNTYDERRNTSSNIITMTQNVTKLGRFFMTRGMIGCFLSHRKCWDECLRSDQMLLVLKEDVFFDDNFHDDVTTSLTAVGQKYRDILLFGAMGCVHRERKEKYCLY